jgi:hypothetical protein
MEKLRWLAAALFFVAASAFAASTIDLYKDPG